MHFSGILLPKAGRNIKQLKFLDYTAAVTTKRLTGVTTARLTQVACRDNIQVPHTQRVLTLGAF
jgi:hypothetical protein